MVYEQADAHYQDTATGFAIAAKRMPFPLKEMDVAVTYHKVGEVVRLITIHPLKEGQKENRIKSGRWVPYEPESAL